MLPDKEGQTLISVNSSIASHSKDASRANWLFDMATGGHQHGAVENVASVAKRTRLKVKVGAQSGNHRGCYSAFEGLQDLQARHLLDEQFTSGERLRRIAPPR
jgi:hypothetical protein